MNIEIRTDNHIQNSERLIDYVQSEIKKEFQRFSDKITHFSVYLKDENGDKKSGQPDIQCTIEARPAGLSPIAVSHKAHNMDTAIHSTIDKLKRSLEHAFEKQQKVR